jgi:ribosomal protein S18 acetylase RimI-like enzyme
VEILRVFNLSKSEQEQVVDLHHHVLEESFLNNFGKDFLRTAYQFMVEDPENIVILALEYNQVLGFAVATLNGDTFSQRVMQAEYPRLLWEILKSSALRPQILSRLLEWKLSPTHQHSIKPELQFLAIEKTHQRQGIGTEIIRTLAEEFNKSGIKRYRVGTKTQNPVSNTFYQKVGFSFIDQENIFGDAFNYYCSP